MSRVKRPSFIKRQKEQARRARAAMKREARLARKHAKVAGAADPDADASTTDEHLLDEEGSASEEEIEVEDPEAE